MLLKLSKTHFPYLEIIIPISQGCCMIKKVIYTQLQVYIKVFFKILVLFLLGCKVEILNTCYTLESSGELK